LSKVIKIKTKNKIKEKWEKKIKSSLMFTTLT